MIRNVDKRLGVGPNYETLKSHPFFKGLPWDADDLKKSNAPFVPDSKKSNFDASHELEEMFIDDSPLRIRRRSASRDYSKLPGGPNGELATQLQLMETSFTNYNFEWRKKGMKPPPVSTHPANHTAMSVESDPSHITDTQHSEIMTDLSRQPKPNDAIGNSWASLPGAENK